MNKLNQLISQFSKILVVFLAGFILLISTACSNTDSPQASRENVGTSVTDVQQPTKSPDYDNYDANQPKQGGMNKYNDDRRLDDLTMDSKTDNAIKQAKANVQRGNDSLGEYADQVSKTGQVLGNIKDDFAQRAGNFKDDISQGARETMGTAKSNLGQASKDVARTVRDTSDTVQNKLSDTAKATQRTAEDAFDTVSNPS